MAGELNTLSKLTMVSSWATFVGCVFIVVSYLAFKEFRHFHLRLVFLLAVTDLCTSLTFILNIFVDNSDELPCTILGASLQFFELSSALWCLCIALTLDQVIRLSNDHVEMLEKYFHFVCWCAPMVTVVASYFLDIFAYVGVWCWISAIHHEAYRWMFFYGPVVMVMCYVITVYVMVSRKIHQQNKLGAVMSSSDTTIQQTFRWFILGWILCWAPAIADRAQGIFYPDNPIYILQCLHAFLTPLGGFCNSIAIGFNDEIQTQYVELFRRFGLVFKEFRKPSRRNSVDRLLRESLKEYEYDTRGDECDYVRINSN